MSRFDDRCWLKVQALFLVLLAALITEPRPLPAQAPDTSTPAQTPAAAPAAQAPAASPAQVPAGTPAPATETPARPTVVLPMIPPTPEQVADSLSAHRQYQAAIAAYAKINNPSAEIWNKMGIAYQMMFNSHDALRCYNASLKLDPHNSQVLNNVATVYDSTKDYGNAERYYRKALKIDPHSAMILRNFGSNQLSQHRYKKGWEYYQQAMKIDPQIFDNREGASVQNPASNQERGAVHYYMARSCVTAGNPDCAIQNLRMALSEGYTNPKKIAGDSSFAALRELPAFQQLIAAQSAP